MNRKLDAVQYGPNNPHPLSTMRTELVWEGKYDEFGSRREVDVAGMAMPLQKIETVDEPWARTEAQGLFFDLTQAHLDDFRNMLIWGDNKLVVASLMKNWPRCSSAAARIWRSHAATCWSWRPRCWWIV